MYQGASLINFILRFNKQILLLEKIQGVRMCRLVILKPFSVVCNGRILYDAPPPMVLELSAVTAMMLRLHLAIGVLDKVQLFASKCWPILA